MSEQQPQQTPQQVPQPAPPQPSRAPIIIGFVLIFVGALFLLSQFVEVSGRIVLGGLGVVFLFVYYLRPTRPLGFLIPGCILVGLGIFTGLEQSGVLKGLGSLFFVLPGLFYGLLGLAFLAIYFIHTGRYCARGGRRYWPLYPGIILVVLGVIFLATERQTILGEEGWHALANWWPLILVVVGGLILYRQLAGKRKQQ